MGKLKVGLLIFNALFYFLLGIFFVFYSANLLSFLGFPNSQNTLIISTHFVSILGIVLIGISVAIVIELFWGKVKRSGLAMIGAGAINIVVSLYLTYWLVWRPLTLSVYMSISMWGITILIALLGTLEIFIDTRLNPEQYLSDSFLTTLKDKQKNISQHVLLLLARAAQNLKDEQKTLLQQFLSDTNQTLTDEQKTLLQQFLSDTNQTLTDEQKGTVRQFLSKVDEALTTQQEAILRRQVPEAYQQFTIQQQDIWNKLVYNNISEYDQRQVLSGLLAKMHTKLTNEQKRDLERHLSEANENLINEQGIKTQQKQQEQRQVEREEKKERRREQIEFLLGSFQRHWASILPVSLLVISVIVGDLDMLQALLLGIFLILTVEFSRRFMGAMQTYGEMPTFETHWGGLGGNLGGWRLSNSLAFLILTLVFGISLAFIAMEVTQTEKDTALPTQTPTQVLSTNTPAFVDTPTPVQGGLP